MIQQDNAGVPPPAQTTGESANGGNAGPATAPVNQKAEPKSDISAEQFNALAAEVRRLKEAASKQPAIPPQDDKRKATTDSDFAAKLAIIEDRQRKEDERAMRANRKSKNAAISEAIAAHGLDEVNSLLLRSLISVEHGQKISVDDESDEVFFQDSEFDAKKPVRELVNAIMASEIGQRLKPPVAVPSSGGMRSGSQAAKLPPLSVDMLLGKAPHEAAAILKAYDQK